MAQASKQYIVDEQGRTTAVVLPIKEYEQLLADMEDLALIAECRNESTEPLENVLERQEKNPF